jgi:hypothetical protein
MSTDYIILVLFCTIDEKFAGKVSRKADSLLSVSEIITLGILFALKGYGKRAFHRWISFNHKHNFPLMHDRTRLFRLLKDYSVLCREFLSSESVMGIIDSFGIELIHPFRQGRSKQQIGRKGKSNHRWIVGMKFVVLINQHGQIVDWKSDTANVHDKHFRTMIEDKNMIVFSDGGFHGKDGDPENMKVCKRGKWNERYLIESLFSSLTRFMNMKKLSERNKDYFDAHLAFASAAFNLVIQLFGSFTSFAL